MALENVITSLVLDVIDHDQTQGVVKAIALDSKTRYVQATIVQHGIDYPVDENATVTLTILRPDNVGVQVTGSVVDVDNADRTGTIKGVYAELTQAALAKSGTLRAQFKVTSGEQILRTEIFQVKNGIALDGETDTWADQYEGYNLDELVENLNSAIAEVNTLDERVDALEEGGSGLTAEAKAAILACFRGVVWRGDVDSDALYSALDTALNPPANLSSISAVYTQSGTVDVSDSLENLRSNLVVTAHYTDNTSAVVTSYTLSGTLTLGTSTITVSYGGKTTTFNVTVTSSWDYVWDLTSSLTDTVSGVTAVASAGTGVDAPAITSAGLVFNAATQRLSLGDINLTGKTIEIDVASFDFKGSDSYHIRFLMNGANTGPIIYKSGNGWQAYELSSSGGSSGGWKTFTWVDSTNRTNKNLFNGKTVKLVSETDNTITLYLDGTAVASTTTMRYSDTTQDLSIGGSNGYTQSSGDQCYDMIISAIRIKTNPTGGDS